MPENTFNLAEKKHILILPRWYPNRHDVQLGNFIRQMAKLLCSTYDISVIYVQADATIHKEFELIENRENNFHEIIVYFKEGQGVFSKIINARRYRKAQTIAYQKLHHKPDCCHVHVPYRSAMLATRLKQRDNIPFYITEHWSGHLNGEWQKKNAADKLLYKKILAQAVKISCVSKKLAEHFKINTGFNAEVIPNLIQFESSVESKLVVDQNKTIQLLSISDLTDKIKNISGLLHAFADALHANKNLHLTVIGGGPDEQDLKNLATKLQIEDKITFTGRLSHDQTMHTLATCDFYICNSQFETFGMACAEALLAGKPVISTRCGGPEEYLNSENSILIPTNDHQALVHAIRDMSKHYQNFEKNKLKQSIQSEFGVNAVLAKWKLFFG
ncbi:MAG: glycosyltransferase [Crocinitomicaceae bacterium]|nr:glycosyltransferase [Crocinitomicaceae bacterium]MBK8926733.1 glycosyltransferase [Crocinitomicaceae bacterium]